MLPRSYLWTLIVAVAMVVMVGWSALGSVLEFAGERDDAYSEIRQYLD